MLGRGNAGDFRGSRDGLSGEVGSKSPTTLSQNAREGSRCVRHFGEVVLARIAGWK
jgi:hypothetical protein